MITIYIDGKPYEVEEGQTIMQAADGLGYHIPRLCYHPKLSIEGACRVCIVEVEGMKNYVASCAYPVTEGMKIRTNSDAIWQARRDIVELILDNHPMDCHLCDRSSNCELQRLANTMGLHERFFTGERKRYEKDRSAAIVRDPEKCILCGRCVRVCSEIQNIHNLSQTGRGFKTVIEPAYNDPMSESVCSNCGQCINVCPTAAFLEKSNAQELFHKLHDPNYIKIAQFAPSVRAAVGEAFDLPVGISMEREMVAALRKMGFDYVFDTQFTADLTIMEEASEFLERFKNGGKLPMITSCSAAWMKYVEQFHPDLLDNISTCKSPMSMLGALIKTYLAEKMGWDPQKILSVAVMCCTAKKYEAARPELMVRGMRAVDIDITTREAAWMFKSAGIDLCHIKGEDFDNPLGESTGAGAIFGSTGGVMEAALRTAYEMHTGEELKDVDFCAVRGLKDIKEATISLNDVDVRVAVAHGLGAASKLLDRVRENPDYYHFIEIMGCPGGCVGGGGQPYAGSNSVPLDEENLRKRAAVLYNIDEHKKLRKSHENPAIQKLYKDYLGEPLSERSHELLHTHYKPHMPHGIIPTKDLKIK